MARDPFDDFDVDAYNASVGGSGQGGSSFDDFDVDAYNANVGKQEPSSVPAASDHSAPLPAKDGGEGEVVPTVIGGEGPSQDGAVKPAAETDERSDEFRNGSGTDYGHEKRTEPGKTQKSSAGVEYGKIALETAKGAGEGLMQGIGEGAQNVIHGGIDFVGSVLNSIGRGLGGTPTFRQVAGTDARTGKPTMWAVRRAPHKGETEDGKDERDAPRRWLDGIGDAIVDYAEGLKKRNDERFHASDEFFSNLAGDIMPIVATGGLATPTLVANGYADNYDNLYKQAREGGKSHEEADRIASTGGVINAAIMGVVAKGPLKTWVGKRFGQNVARAVEKSVMDGEANSMSGIVRSGTKWLFKNTVKDVGVSTVESGLLFGGQAAFNEGASEYARGEDIDPMKITMAGYEGAKSGVAMSLAMGGVQLIGQRAQYRRDVEDAAWKRTKSPRGATFNAMWFNEGTADLLQAERDGTLKSGKRFRDLKDRSGLPSGMTAKEAETYAKTLRSLGFTEENLRFFRRDKENYKRLGLREGDVSGVPMPDNPDVTLPPEAGASELMARELRSRGIEPVKFTVPSEIGADGRPVPRFTKVKVKDNYGGVNGVFNIAIDENAKVAIIDNGDGTYTAYDSYRNSETADSIDEAIEKAQMLALIQQVQNSDRQVKERVIRTEAEKYGNWDTLYYPTMEDAADAIDGLIAANGGSWNGLTDTGFLRTPDKAGRDAFYVSDNRSGGKRHGVAFLILDNIKGVEDIPRILGHEHVGHGGPNAEFGGSGGAVEFAENVRSKEFEAFKKDVVAGARSEVRARDMEAVNRNLGEVFAHYAAANLDREPSKLDRLVSAVNSAARKLKLRKTYSAADVKTMMARWKAAGRGEGGVVEGRADVPERFEFFPVEERKTTTEMKDETGNVRDETPAKPEQGAAEPAGGEAARPVEAQPQGGEAPRQGVVEPRRMTSAEEVIATAKTSFNDAEKAALEAASDVSGIDATDEMPAQTDFLSILSKDAPVVRLNPAKVDRSDAVLPNMKKDANRTSGITKPLSGEWHPTMGGIGAARLTKDGKLVVITGRHRSELAERKGKSMLYYLYREADGFTKDDALIYDAVANIHDEKGTINDYLGFLDRINPTREQAEKAGILSGKGLVAWSLYKDATEAVRSTTAMDGNPGEGQISPQQATVIAEAAPRDADKRNPSIQRQLLKTALGGMRGKAFDMYARIRAEKLSRTPINENLLVGEQMDLFSSPEDQAADILAQRQSQYRTKKANGYGEVARNLRTALNGEGKLELNEEYAKELGVTDKTDRKQLESAYDKAVERANYWENAVRLEDADKAAMDAEINAAADARAKKLAELKAKREAAKSGKSAPKATVNYNGSPVYVLDDNGEIQEGRITDVAKGGKTRVEYGNHSVLLPQNKIFATREIAEKELLERKRQAGAIKGIAPNPRENAPVSAPKETVATTPPKEEKSAPVRESRTTEKSSQGGTSTAVRAPRTTENQDEANNLDEVRAAFEREHGVKFGADGFTKWTYPEKGVAERHEVIDGLFGASVITERIDLKSVRMYITASSSRDSSYRDEVAEKTKAFLESGGNVDALIKWKDAPDVMEDIVMRAAKKMGVKLTRDAVGHLKQFDKILSELKSKFSNVYTSTAKTPSIKMKDEAAEKLAQQQEDDLAALFDTPELGIIGGDEGKEHKLVLDENRLGGSLGIPRDAVPNRQLIEKVRAVLAVEGKSAARAMWSGRISQNTAKALFDALNSDKATADLFKRVFPVAQQLGIEYSFAQYNGQNSSSGDGMTLAQYDRGEIRLFANTLQFTSPQTFASTILHEAIHGVTVYAMEVANGDIKDAKSKLTPELAAAAKEIFDIYEKNKPWISKEYGFTDAYEMIAELSNPRFRESLKKKSIWRRIWDAIKRLFGFKPSNAHDATAAALDRFVENYSKDVFGSYVKDANRNSLDGGLLGINARFSIQKAEKGMEAASKFLAWAKKWKLDPSKESVRKEWAEKNSVQFDTPEFDPDMFQKRVGAVAKLVKTYKDSGVADFKTLATRMAERFPEKFDAMKPYLRGVWNAVADQMNLSDVSRIEAERVYGIIDSQAKEATNEPADHGTDGGVRATADGGERPGGILADRHVREQDSDGRVDGERSGAVPGLGGRLAEGETSERREEAGDGTADGNVAVGDKAGSALGESRDGRDRAEDGDNAPVRVKKRAAKAADDTKFNPPRRDFTMTKAVEDAILEKKTAQRVRNNLDAIKLIRDLKARDYAATPEEQETLAKFVGWGGLREDVFNYDLERSYDVERSGTTDFKSYLKRQGISQSAYGLHKELRQVLNDNEYESAKASASTAFYTPLEFVRVLHDALRRLGVKGGRFLGPSAGTGNFASAAGQYEKPVNWQFVEKDAMTGEILKALFPNQRVTVGGFEDTKFPDGFFDFAIDNVPYADVPINDRSLSSKMFKIHDYFFAKTLAKLRPGGVMAFLTSTGTLDKTSPILRQFLTEHGGRIVGAVRLPNGFFAENAGTDVASDLVIVQKVQGRPDNAAFEKGVEYGKTSEWVRRKGRVEKPLTYNGYFQDHPEQIVGEMTVGSGQFGPTLQYKMPPKVVRPGEKGLWEQMNDAVSRAFAGVDKDALLKSASVSKPQEVHAPVYDEEGLRQGNVTMKDGKPFIKSGDMLEPIELPKDRTLSKEIAKRLRTPKQIMEGLIGLRKAMRDVIDAQMSDSDIAETDLTPLFAKLNEVYDAFVKKNGLLHDKWVSPFVLLDKADGNRLLALERVVKDENGKPKIVKSDIFSKRVISRGQKATKADTPKDALVICYSENGGINVPRIAELLGVDADEAVQKLKESGDVFENPQTGLLEPSWEYLSGRVRAKLAAARAAVDAGEESYRANVEALEKVQPPMVRLEDAEIKFGATWVDPECMKDFLRDAFGSENMRLALGKNEVTGQWNVELGRVMNEDPWGETSWDPKEFVSRVLNHGSMNHYVTDPVDKKRYLDERRTEANKLAAEKLHHAFSQFIQSSETWAAPCYERYNAVMTDMVEISLPNNILPFRSAGMSEATLGKLFEGSDPKTPKKGREYQSAVIARGVLGNGSLCLAHCVGAGKTLEMQSIGVLGRHLGLFKKPMYVVPNHMLEQFTNEFVEAFPNANILKMSEDDVKPENRRAFFAQVANGDWDAIVVKHSTFSKKLAMSAEYQKEFIEAQCRDLIEAIAAMREAGEKISVDQATKKLERLEAKLEQLQNAENHDSQIVPFDELGVDQLFVDEAHNFKGMPITTRQGRTGGLSQGDSQRAVDMQMKTQYVQSLHGGDRGVVFATGTPLSNAPVVEAYVILKYLAPNKLQEQGLKHFDDFADAFGRITTESEFSLDGKTVKEKEKVSAFVNIPELMKLLRSVVDIVNPDQLDIPRPKPKYHMIDVDMTKAQEAIMEMVAREAATPPSREERNKYLTLTRIAKNACLTPRLLGYEDGGNKIIRAVAEIKKVYDETADNRGAQLVFTDIFNRAGAGTDTYISAHMSGEDVIPRSGRDYNLNEEIRDLLVQAGVPKDEIAIIQDIDKSKGDKDANKGALFAKVRSGDVRILIGSRPKMGEGTNVQERLAAIHLLHPGWKPAEDEQAIGRIIRFGNTYKEGQIFYYLTKGNANIGSYETKNHQLVGSKDKLIDQVMHGDDTVREIDMDESAMDRDMLMGLASGNKALMELIDVKKRVHKLELNTESTMISARRNKDKAEANARILERRREEFAKEQEGVKEWREKNDGKPFTLSTLDGRSIEKVKDMAEYVAAQMTKLLTQDRYDRSERTVLGDFNGVEMILAYDRWGDEKFRLAVPLLGVAREINYSGFIPDFSQAAMTAFKGKIFETVSPDFAKAYENSLNDMDRQAKKMSADADRLQKDYEGMRDELIKLRTRQAELERAVTPLMIQAVENRKIAAYGNWIVTKPAGGTSYVAQRESDAKRITAPTVKELIPLMDAEDFASPRSAAIKTTDLRPRLKPNSKGEYPGVDTIPVSQVDFDTPELSAKGLREHDAVVARYTNADGTKKPGWMKAPNGKPTKLTERQWVQVRTPSFKKWFGDWEKSPANASKVVDENGEPMVVYHGTPHGGHTVFNGRKNGSYSASVEGTTFFSSSQNVALSYSTDPKTKYRDLPKSALEEARRYLDSSHAEVREEHDGRFGVYLDGEYVANSGADTRETALEKASVSIASSMEKNPDSMTYGVFLSVKNPVAVDFKGGLWNGERSADGYYDNSVPMIAEHAKRSGHDGVIVKNVQDAANILGRGIADDYAVFSPTQIKSATDNNSDFSRTNPDINFDSPELDPAEQAYAEAEDKTPSEQVMREVYGMTNDEIATAMKAAWMEPPKHVRKPDETAWKQAEALLSNPSYMAKLSRAVAKFPRNISDYENNALNVLFRQRQADVNAAQSVVDGLKETLDAFDAIPKEERDTDFNTEQQKTAKDYGEARAKLAQAKSLMYETGLALTRSSSEAGRRLRSNRGLIDQTDHSYAGISGQVAAILGGADRITPEMDARIREIAGEFASLDEAGRDLATARLKAHAEKIVEQIKRGDKVRKATERKQGDEAKRVMRNYNDALAQIEVGAAEVGGTLVGLSDQQYPSWGKWLRAIGEFHCFENPDITEEECVRAIVEDISPFMDGVDENQVRDALTGFGHNFRQSRYDAQRLMNDLRSQARLKRQMDWMDETNTMPPLTGMVRDEPSDTTRNLQKQVQERKKEIPDAGRDERRLKGVLESAKTRVKNRIADLERAIETRERIPGRERTVPEDIELRELKKRRDALQQSYDELFKTERGLTDEQRVKLAERLLGRELEHALEDLARARSGDFSKRPKRPGVESPSIDALRDRLNEVREQIRALKKAKYEFGMTPEELDAYNARKMANREKALARLAERIVNGDLRQQKKPQPPMPPEMKKRYDELGEQMNRAHRKLADMRREAADARKPRFVRFSGDAYRFIDGVWKMATASLDFTQVGNQTGTILMAHPKIVAENFAKTISAFKSQTNADNIELDLLSDPSVKEAVDNKWLHWKRVSDSSNRGDRVELFDAIDRPFTIGGKPIRLIDIPFYGTAIANSDRLYATYINAVSASLYSSIVNDPKLFPGGATVFQKKMICDMINVMNGSGTLSKGARRHLGKVFWAPGLVDSQLKRLLGYQIWHPWIASAEEDGSGTFKERVQMSRIGLGEFVRSNLGALLLGGLLFALFATDDQKDEYSRAGAVKKLQMLVAPRIRHTQLDFTGGSVAFLRLGNRLVSGAYETATGKQAKVRDTFGEVAHFAKGRLTPLVSNAFSALSGKDYTGQDYGAAELLLSFAPISLRDAGKSIYENGIEDRAWATAFLGAGLTMFGIGKGTYRKDDYKILTNRFLEAKKEFDTIESDDLLDEQHRQTLLDSIRDSDPLMRDNVREDIADDIAQIRKDEAEARKDEKEGVEADASLLSEIEQEKAALIEKIRSSR